MANRFEQYLIGKLKRAVATLPKVLANEAVNYSLDAFKEQAWDGKAWAPRKNKRNSRALLVASGRLRRDTRADNITSTGFVLVNDVPYARIHNDGGAIRQAARSETFTRNRFSKGSKKGSFKKGTKAGKGFTYKERTINMPQRKFMGKSDALVQRLINKGRQHLLKQLNT